MIITEQNNEVLIVTINNPPVNALGSAVRQGLLSALEKAESDPSVQAVILTGNGRGFSAGADITEFGQMPSGPSLPAVIDRFEASAKPIVAAIHGPTMGGGLELALGCHYRIASDNAKLGLPEVKLGLIPGAGGTQRLPRIAGMTSALEMIVKGNPVSANKALKMRIVSEVTVHDDLKTKAVDFAQAIISRKIHPVARQGTAHRDEMASNPKIIEDYLAKVSRRIRGFDAPVACIEAIKASLDSPFDEGIKRERELFVKLVSGDQSKAQRHVFFAERAASKIDDVPKDIPLIAINKVGVLGAGTMGGGITMNFLSAGIPVTIIEREEAALNRGVGIIRKNYERTAKRGRLSSKQVEDAMALLTPSLSYDDLSNCDLIIEAIYENMDVKKSVFTQLDSVAKEGAILASNTSYLNVDEIASATSRPESVIGLHFFSPANIMRLLEIVRGEKTSSSVLATSMKLAKKINKIAVVSGVCFGFIGNRMLSPRQRQAESLMLGGVLPWEMDRILVKFGMPMGPYQMGDLAGLDLGWRKETSKGETLREILCERDRRGQKTGKGYYDYDENRRGTPSAEVEEIIAGLVEKAGGAKEPLNDQEILELLLYPMVNEGAKILEEGIAQRSSDIDIVWINGYGWPPYQGGPMFWADNIGLDKIVAGLKKHQDRMYAGFKLSPLLEKLASEGSKLSSYKKAT